MAKQRILRATAATLQWQPQDADGEPADPGIVTVGVTGSDGSTIVAAATATGGTGTDPRTVALTAVETASVDRVTATWTADGTVVATTYHDVVGGYFFSITELRNGETSLSDAENYPLEQLVIVRAEVETLFEDACGQAFVPRFEIDRVTDSGYRFWPAWRPLRRVGWVRQYSDYTVPTYTDYTAGEVAQVVVGDDGFGTLPYSTSGYLSVQIGYEHGWDSPPADIKRAAMTWARMQANRSKSGIPDRATTMQLPDGGSVTLATPGVGRWHTGVPEIDEVLRRYTVRGPLVA